MTHSFPTRRSSDLGCSVRKGSRQGRSRRDKWRTSSSSPERGGGPPRSDGGGVGTLRPDERFRPLRQPCGLPPPRSGEELRSEEHTSELQSLMRISYAVFCLKKKTAN